MDEQFITCPKCGEKIPLSEALTHQIADGLRQTISAEYSRKFSDEKAKIEQKAEKKAAGRLALELKDRDEQIKEKSELPRPPRPPRSNCARRLARSRSGNAILSLNCSASWTSSERLSEKKASRKFRGASPERSREGREDGGHAQADRGFEAAGRAGFAAGPG